MYLLIFILGFFIGSLLSHSNQYADKNIFVSFLNGTIWLILFFKIGLVWYYPFVALSFSMLLLLSVIDFKYYAVPDNINLTSLLLSLINPNFLISLLNAMLGALIIFLIGYITQKLYKRETLGGADIIVSATMASLLGFPLFFVAIFTSSLLALIPSLLAKDKIVPFVPFLFMGTFLTYIIFR